MRTSSRTVNLLLVILLAVLAAVGAAGWLILTPYGWQRQTIVDVTPGSSATRIGRQLEEAGVIRSRYAFDLTRLIERGTLQAGEYRFNQPLPLIEVYERIARGDVFTIALTVPEGANCFDIAERVQAGGFGSSRAFLDAVVAQADLVADLDPGAKSLEGYLFPDTYRFSPKASPEEILAAMVRRFRSVAAQIGLRENVHQVVTLASLVERETAVGGERPLVASVYANRLKKKMPLMADPAVIYGLELEGLWRGSLYQSDLDRDTPYNTYQHPGLPPGPIDNPGIPSLRAAMRPANTDYLYFVAAGDNPQGRSLFSNTLDQHVRNVDGYRKALKRSNGR
jgi:peptidoglycan lytic transglycosylase G